MSILLGFPSSNRATRWRKARCRTPWSRVPTAVSAARSISRRTSTDSRGPFPSGSARTCERRSPPALRSFVNDQKILGVDLLTGAGENLFDCPIALGAQRGLHFHRLQRQYHLAPG